jgi:hypothetical protein
VRLIAKAVQRHSGLDLETSACRLLDAGSNVKSLLPPVEKAGEFFTLIHDEPDLLTGDRNSVIKVAIKFKEQGRSRRRRIRVNLAGIS